MICRICYLPAGGCHIPVPGVLYYSGTGIIIGTRTVHVLYLYEIGAWLPILVAADQAPMHTLPNSTSTQSRGAEAKHKHKHGRCRGQPL